MLGFRVRHDRLVGRTARGRASAAGAHARPAGENVPRSSPLRPTTNGDERRVARAGSCAQDRTHWRRSKTIARSTHDVVERRLLLCSLASELLRADKAISSTRRPARRGRSPQARSLTASREVQRPYRQHGRPGTSGSLNIDAPRTLRNVLERSPCRHIEQRMPGSCNNSVVRKLLEQPCRQRCFRHGRIVAGGPAARPLRETGSGEAQGRSRSVR